MRRLSPDFPEVCVSLRTLVFDARWGCLSNLSGAKIPRASSPRRPRRALAKLSLTGASPLGANASSRATLLCLCVPSAGSQSVSSYNSRPRPNFPFWAGILSHAFAFPRGRRSDRAPGSSWAPSEDYPDQVSAQLGSPPSPPEPRPLPPTAALRELLRLMRPGCFRFVFTPSSPQLGTLRKKKVGVKSVCPDKVAGTPRLGRKRGGGVVRTAKAEAWTPLFLAGSPGLFTS